MKDKTGKHPETLLTHSGRHPFEHFGVVNTPVFRASTILQETMAEYKRPKGPREPRYGRRGTPTTFTLEDVIADVEGAHGCLLASSGLNAIAVALLSQVKQGDHILMADNVYGPARNFANHVMTRMGVETEFFDPAIEAEFLALCVPILLLSTWSHQAHKPLKSPMCPQSLKRQRLVVPL